MEEYKSLKITKLSHDILKDYCDKKHIKLTKWVSDRIIEVVRNLEKSDV